MVDRVLISSGSPLKSISSHRSGNCQTIVDARFDLRSLLIVIPGHQLQIIQLFRRVVETIDCRECLQPGPAALLSHDAPGSPGGEGIVETFVSGSNCLLARERHARVVET